MGGEQALELTHQQPAREVERAIAERRVGVGHDVVVGKHERPSCPRRPVERGHAAPHQSGLEARFERRARAHPRGRATAEGTGTGGRANDALFASPSTIPRSVYK